MNLTFVVFMSVLSTVSLLATLVILYQIVKESAANKRARIEADRQLREAVLRTLSENRGPATEQTVAAVAQPVCVTVDATVEASTPEQAPAVAVDAVPAASEPPAPAPEAVPAASEPPAPAPEAAPADGTISFASAGRQTLDEQYLALSKEQKRFYDKIAAYAAAKEGNKCIKNQRYQEYKIGTKRIVRLRIKRGILHCEFLMINRDLRNHISENKIPVKESATVIKVQSKEMVEMVFSSIDLAIQLIEEERAYKKQLARERRRQANQRQE